jgi:multiple antibiotic resistance protein
LTGNFNKKRGVNKKRWKAMLKKMILTPLAIPMLAGPGSISLLIAFYHEHHSIPDIIFSILAILQ